MIQLRTITENNFKECLSLQASVDNQNFVDPVVYSLAEAWLNYEDIKPFAIYEDDNMIGFVSMFIGGEHYQIINFLIDDAFQKRGYGTKAVYACIRFLQEKYNASRISVPVEIENTIAQKFWGKLGFNYSDNVEDGYVFMRLNLS